MVGRIALFVSLTIVQVNAFSVNQLVKRAPDVVNQIVANPVYGTDANGIGTQRQSGGDFTDPCYTHGVSYLPDIAIILFSGVIKAEDCQHQCQAWSTQNNTGCVNWTWRGDISGYCGLSSGRNGTVPCKSGEMCISGPKLCERKPARVAGRDLDAYQTAFKKMHEKDCMDGTSWYYQGAIHWVPNATNINGTDYPLCQKYRDDGQLQFGWKNCTHTGTYNSHLHFLLWHRLYIWHLEKIVRNISGNSFFSLPYWEYVVEDGREMPKAFQKEGSCLCIQSRNATLNEGKPIPDEWFSNITQHVERMKNNTHFYLFSTQLENNPHNYMHRQIGGSNLYDPITLQSNRKGMMSLLDGSAFDPIFYLHHGVIDYLFWKWDTSEYGHRPCLETLEKYPWQYNFIQPDGSEVTYTIKEAYDLVYNPDYSYEGLPKLSGSSGRNCSKELSEATNLIHIVLNYKSDNQSEYTIDFTQHSVALNEQYDAEDGKILYVDLTMVIYDLCESLPVYLLYNLTGTVEQTYIGMITQGETGIEQNYLFDVTAEYKDSDEAFQVVIQSKKQCSSDWTLLHVDANSINNP